MLELVGVFVLLLVQVNEVMRDALLAALLHVPADLERVAGDVADLDALRDGQLLRVGDGAVLGFTSCAEPKSRLVRHVDLWPLNPRLCIHYTHSSHSFIAASDYSASPLAT